MIWSGRREKEGEEDERRREEEEERGGGERRREEEGRGGERRRGEEEADRPIVSATITHVNDSDRAPGQARYVSRHNTVVSSCQELPVNRPSGLPASCSGSPHHRSPATTGIYASPRFKTERPLTQRM